MYIYTIKETNAALSYSEAGTVAEWSSNDFVGI